MAVAILVVDLRHADIPESSVAAWGIGTRGEMDGRWGVHVVNATVYVWRPQPALFSRPTSRASAIDAPPEGEASIPDGRSATLPCFVRLSKRTWASSNRRGCECTSGYGHSHFPQSRMQRPRLDSTICPIAASVPAAERAAVAYTTTRPSAESPFLTWLSAATDQLTSSARGNSQPREDSSERTAPHVTGDPLLDELSRATVAGRYRLSATGLAEQTGDVAGDFPTWRSTFAMWTTPMRGCRSGESSDCGAGVPAVIR